jgi:hypothetical protein
VLTRSDAETEPIVDWSREPRSESEQRIRETYLMIQKARGRWGDLDLLLLNPCDGSPIASDLAAAMAEAEERIRKRVLRRQQREMRHIRDLLEAEG